MSLLGLDAARGRHGAGQLAHRLALEQILRREKMPASPARAASLIERMESAAELEEVVVDADGIETRTSAQIVASRRSLSVAPGVTSVGDRFAGATTEVRAASSIFPCGVSGIASSTTMTDGTIASGRRSCSQLRSEETSCRPSRAGRFSAGHHGGRAAGAETLAAS